MAKKKPSNSENDAAQQRVGVNGKPVGPGNPPRDACFKKGESGNPKGRPNAGASVIEFWSLMQESTLAEIIEVADDEGTPAAKRAAAKIWCDALSGDVAERMQALGKLIEFCNGRARQGVEITTPERGQMSDEAMVGMMIVWRVHPEVPADESDCPGWPPAMLARYENSRIDPVFPARFAERIAKRGKTKFLLMMEERRDKETKKNRLANEAHEARRAAALKGPNP